MYTKSMDISPESSVLHVECSAVVSRMEQVHERTRDYDFWRLMHIECVCGCFLSNLSWWILHFPISFLGCKRSLDQSIATSELDYS